MNLSVGRWWKWLSLWHWPFEQHSRGGSLVWLGGTWQAKSCVHQKKRKSSVLWSAMTRFSCKPRFLFQSSTVLTAGWGSSGPRLLTVFVFRKWRPISTFRTYGTLNLSFLTPKNKIVLVFTWRRFHSCYCSSEGLLVSGIFSWLCGCILVMDLLWDVAEADGALDKTRRHKKRQLEDTLHLVMKKRKVTELTL